MSQSRTNELGQPIGEPLTDWQAPPVPTMATLVGRTCRLEKLDAAKHGAELHRANAAGADARNWTYLPYGPFDAPDAYLDWIQAQAASVDPAFYSIIDTATEKPVGVASYLRIEPSQGAIEVGHIHYSPLLQRHVAATEAMYLMAQHVFELGYRRYEWKCDSLNGPSRAAAVRYGFTFEGIFRQATMYKGRNRDTAWYSMLDREWPRLQATYQQWLSPENFDEDGGQIKRLAELMATN